MVQDGPAQGGRSQIIHIFVDRNIIKFHPQSKKVTWLDSIFKRSLRLLAEKEWIRIKDKQKQKNHL